MDLNECRSQIDAINKELIRLFRERMVLSGEVAAYKKEHNLPIYNPTREREILADMAEAASPEFSSYARVFFTEIMELSRAYQAKLLGRPGRISDMIRRALAETVPEFPRSGTVACQGVEGAYSQIACDRMFGAQKILYCKRFEDVFEAVEDGRCDYGVLPIENSTYGTVNEVYDLLRTHHCSIVRSMKQKIDHTLLAPVGTTLSDVREVYSHNQAIGQCSRFLRSHPEIHVNICENTAMAAKAVAESGQKNAAAISSRACAQLYGLSVLPEKIMNSDSNFTRFICISKDLKIFPGASRISLLLTLPHRPGALYSMLSRLAAEGVNLTKLENRPIEGSDFEVRFYFDFETSLYSEKTLELLDEIEAGCEEFVFLGGYTEQ